MEETETYYLSDEVVGYMTGNLDDTTRYTFDDLRDPKKNTGVFMYLNDDYSYGYFTREYFEDWKKHEEVESDLEALCGINFDVMKFYESFYDRPGIVEKLIEMNDLSRDDYLRIYMNEKVPGVDELGIEFMIASFYAGVPVDDILA